MAAVVSKQSKCRAVPMIQSTLQLRILPIASIKLGDFLNSWSEYSVKLRFYNYIYGCDIHERVN